MLALLGCLLLGLALAGCGNEESKGGGLAEVPQEANQQQESAQVASVEQARTTDDPDLKRCVAVPKGLLAHLTSALKVEGPGTLKHAQAVRSQDTEVTFVAAEIHGEGLEGDQVIGTWAVNDFAAGTGVYAVDEVATKYSRWPPAADAAPALDADDAAAQAAAGCVRAQQP
jgi:hypothetical protein